MEFYSKRSQYGQHLAQANTAFSNKTARQTAQPTNNKTICISLKSFKVQTLVHEK